MKELWGQDAKVAKILSPREVRSGEEYRLSKYAIRFEAGARECLYSVFTRQCLELEGFIPEDRLYTAEEILTDDRLVRLVRDRFLVPKEEKEEETWLSVVRVLRLMKRKKGYTTYTILPTMACNARCTYCFEEGRTPVSMSRETEESMLSFIRSTREHGRQISLSWFGGEPLLSEGLIDRVSDRLALWDIDFKASMVTNGSLIDGKIADKMAGPWRVGHIQLSMDCDEGEYIRRKRYLHYRDDYHRVMRSAGLLAGRGITVSIRCNVDAGNIDGMESFLKDLDRELPEKEGIAVYFTPLYDAEGQSAGPEIWEQIRRAEAQVRAMGFKSVTGVHPKNLKTAYCMRERPYGQVVISPEGYLYNCEHCLPGESFGDVEHGVTDAAYLPSFFMPEEIREKCRDCRYLPECTSFSRCPTKRENCRDERAYALGASLIYEAEMAAAEAEEAIAGAGNPDGKAAGA